MHSHNPQDSLQADVLKNTRADHLNQANSLQTRVRRFLPGFSLRLEYKEANAILLFSGRSTLTDKTSHPTQGFDLQI